MSYPHKFVRWPGWTGSFRRGVEYAATIALALLASYWIVRGGW